MEMYTIRLIGTIPSSEGSNLPPLKDLAEKLAGKETALFRFKALGYEIYEFYGGANLKEVLSRFTDIISRLFKTRWRVQTAADYALEIQIWEKLSNRSVLAFFSNSPAALELENINSSGFCKEKSEEEIPVETKIEAHKVKVEL